MADHYVSLNRGEPAFAQVDFTTGTSSTAGDGIEVRVLDGASWSRAEVIQKLEAFKRFFADAKRTTTAGFDISG